MRFISILILVIFSEASFAQYYNECKPSFGNDTMILDNQYGKYMVDSFYNDTLIRKRIYEDWGMSAEVYYDKEGLINESVSRYKNGLKQWVEHMDYNTGHRIWAGWYENGQMENYCEVATDSFDAVYENYFPNGNLAVTGFYRKEKVRWIKSYTDTSFILLNESFYELYNQAKVGFWHFYYPDGRDSAFGSYAYESYEFDSVIPYSPGDLVIAIMITNFTEIKTGTWNYFSREGKLIMREEWEKGNLIRREK